MTKPKLRTVICPRCRFVIHRDDVHGEACCTVILPNGQLGQFQLDDRGRLTGRTFDDYDRRKGE